VEVFSSIGLGVDSGGKPGQYLRFSEKIIETLAGSSDN